VQEPRWSRSRSGGEDSGGNLLAGVDLIRRADWQHVQRVHLAAAARSDGKKRFGKSEDGAVWLAADAHVALTSSVLVLGYDRRGRRHRSGFRAPAHVCCPSTSATPSPPRHAEAPHQRAGQRLLAREITTIVHGPEATAAAREAERDPVRRLTGGRVHAGA